MENLFEDESLNNSDESSNSINKENTKDLYWKINFEKELLFWDTIVLQTLVYQPNICPKCKLPTYKIYKKQSKDILNPYYIKCTRSACQKRESLRKYSILNLAKLIPASIIYEIIILFIIEKKNAKEIEFKLKDMYPVIPNYNTILKILTNTRKIIAEYLKYSYKLSQIGGDPETERTVAIDETLITHSNGNQIWLIGAIDTTNHNIRLDVLPDRNSENIKIFITNHIIPGTNITHDGWLGYNCLDDDDSVWTHETHNHGAGDFGQGTHSTSHIEGYWGFLKAVLKKLYPIFPNNNYIYYIREGELRTKISDKPKQKIISILLKMFKIVYEYCQFEFSSEEDILNFENYDY